MDTTNNEIQFYINLKEIVKADPCQILRKPYQIFQMKNRSFNTSHHSIFSQTGDLQGNTFEKKYNNYKKKDENRFFFYIILKFAIMLLYLIIQKPRDSK